jgi:hypothetical protein
VERSESKLFMLCARYCDGLIMIGDSVLQDDVSCMPFSSAGLLVLLLLLTGLRNTVCELVCDQRWVYFGFEGLRELASNTGSVNDWTAVLTFFHVSGGIKKQNDT